MAGLGAFQVLLGRDDGFEGNCSYSEVFPGIERESFDRDDRGRDSNAVPSPGPYPARRINEMTAGGEQCCNVFTGQVVSSEGFNFEMAAGVAIRNCLRSGVHSTSL